MNGNFELLTLKELAKYLHRKRETIYQLEKRYDDFPPKVKIGRSVFYRLKDVEAFMKNRFSEAGIQLESNSAN